MAPTSSLGGFERLPSSRELPSDDDEEAGSEELPSPVAASAGGATRRRVVVAGATAVLCAGAAFAALVGGGRGHGAATGQLGAGPPPLAPLASTDALVSFASSSSSSDPFTCAKFGCLDVRSPTNPCQCSQYCVKEGTCCPDYQATCARVTPATNPRLGQWPGCGKAAAPPANPGVWHYAAKGPELSVKVMSYNPEWWHVIEQLGGNGNGPAKIIMAAMHSEPLDFIGFQEFYDPWFGLTRPGADASSLLDAYTFIRGEVGGPVGTIIGFRKAAWSLISRGQQFVGEDRKGPLYFGKRIILWARLVHHATGKTVFFANHHGPLPLNTGGVCGCAVTASNLLHVIGTSAQPGDAVLFVGDFNADEHSGTIGFLNKYLRGNFVGIDHIFSNLDAAALTEKKGWGTGGSDHSAISATFQLPAASSGSASTPAASQ